MLTLHYLVDSRAQRILWMLEEMGTPYDLKVYPRHPSTNLAPRELRDVHPLGHSPVITDGDRTIAESGAIVEHLARTYGPNLLPDDLDDLTDCQYWTHFAEGSLAPLLVTTYVFTVARSKIPFFLRPILMMVPNLIGKNYLNPNLSRHLHYANDHLKDREFFVGDALSVADIMMSFPLEASASRTDIKLPHVTAWVDRMQARPAYQRALDAAGVPYAYGPR